MASEGWDDDATVAREMREMNAHTAVDVVARAAESGDPKAQRALAHITELILGTARIVRRGGSERVMLQRCDRLTRKLDAKYGTPDRQPAEARKTKNLGSRPV